MKSISEIAGEFPIMKMHGCGNDFVVMVDWNEELIPEQVKKICERNYGIGSDGLITVTQRRNEDSEYRMKFFNPDGTTAQMCGNGIRCFAKYLVDNNFSELGEVDVDTDAGLRIPNVLENTSKKASVLVDMGKPVLYNPNQVTVSPGDKGFVNFSYPQLPFDITFVSMGNPHAVVFYEFPEELVLKYGPMIERDISLFPQKTNVEFVKVNSKDLLEMRVWERGAGETLACGTGACASLVAAVLNGYANNSATVRLKGGDLSISWDGKDGSVYMKGNAENVCSIDAKSLDKYLLG
ncbi:MAG: diaminopimelate epimerase [Candidatus Woesearchaeota archaeon]|jgi:diaminopimelate epimerase